MKAQIARMKKRGSLLVVFLLFVVMPACTKSGGGKGTATGTPPTTAPSTVPATVTEERITPSPPEQTTTPAVTGSLTIEDGRCCTGGVAGEPLAINVALAASSTAGEVTEMRAHTATGGCADKAQMAAEAWQPFASTATFSFTPPINWVTFYMTVDFRDEAGNVSPPYCGSIAVEGMPAP